MPGPRFSHLALAVEDLDRQTTFYCTALGFRPGDEYVSRGRRVAALMEAEPSGFRGVFLALDGFFLELLAYVHHEPSALPRPAAEPGFAHISLVVADLAGTLVAVRESGGSVRQTFEHTFTGTDASTTIAFCVDPEGNRVELIEHANSAEADGHAAFLGLTDLHWAATRNP